MLRTYQLKNFCVTGDQSSARYVKDDDGRVGKVRLHKSGRNLMLDTDREIEALLRAAWVQESSGERVTVHPVLRKARRRLAVRNVTGFMLGRIWLALAKLCAPVVTGTHRSRRR